MANVAVATMWHVTLADGRVMNRLRAAMWHFNSLMANPTKQ